MTIAVHIAVPETDSDINSSFNYNCFSILAAKYPDNHYIFIFDKPFPPELIKQKNIIPVLTGPPVRNRLLQYYFYNFKIPKLLTKYNAALFVSAEVCSLRTKIPQYLILSDLSFFKKNNLYSKSDARYLKKYLRFFIKRSAKIGVLNTALKTILTKSFPANEEKIKVLSMGVSDRLAALSFEKAEGVRSRFTEGKEYFLFFHTASSAENALMVLKAFSIFKKWQKSNMQLLVLSDEQDEEKIVRGFSTYKYRADVKMIKAGSSEIRENIIAAAYTAIYLPAIEMTESQGLITLACEIPLLTTDNEFCRSIYGDGAIYTLVDEQELAEKMMLLYKDEAKKNRLVQSGNAVVSKHRWPYIADLFMQTIQPGAAV